MRVEPLGDRAYILRDLDAPAHLVAAKLNLHRPDGLVEAVASYDTVGLYTEPGFNPDALDATAQLPETEPAHHQIPVCYTLGEDLNDACDRLSITPDRLVESHCSVTYACFAVGFCPGFAYLGHLPEALRGLPRLSSPRVRVEPGSVGITGSQTGVYPLPRPGGWILVGRTPLTLVDVADGYFPIQAGDTVRFFPIGREEFEARKGERL